MKSDNRKDGFVTAEEATRLKRKIGARVFVECSAKNNENVEDIFKAALQVVGNKKRPKKCCVVQ